MCVGGGSGQWYFLCDPRPSHTVVLDLTLSCRLPGVKPGLRFKRSSHQRQQCSHSGLPPPPSFHPIKVTRQAALGESEDSPGSLGQSLPYCGC